MQSEWASGLSTPKFGEAPGGLAALLQQVQQDNVHANRARFFKNNAISPDQFAYFWYLLQPRKWHNSPLNTLNRFASGPACGP